MPNKPNGPMRVRLTKKQYLEPIECKIQTMGVYNVGPKGYVFTECVPDEIVVEIQPDQIVTEKSTRQKWDELISFFIELDYNKDVGPYLDKLENIKDIDAAYKAVCGTEV